MRSGPPRFGVTMFVTDRSLDPVSLAVEAEARGFASLYLPEHTHIPTSRRTPPPTGDAELAEEYRRTLDPFVALAAAAARTARLVVGTGVCLVAQRDPIVTAKAVATLDLLAPGRVVLGVGGGWNVEEMASHGVDARTRRARMREHVLAMRALWTQDEASFHGDFVRFEAAWQWPKPSRPPPVLVGGFATPKLFEHVAEWADGWMPIGGAGVAEALPALGAAFEARGRDPATAHVCVFGALAEPAKVAYYASVGVDEIVFRVPHGGRDAALATLDRCAAARRALA